MKLDSDKAAEIEASHAQKFTTKRPTVPALEEKMFTPIHCLDHGFVRLVDYMGDDSAIVQAARVSYGAGTKKMRQDRGLIRYLLRHRHTTPFEMCEIKLHVKLPIFVARQWIRHRTANVNEISARYSVLDNEFYLPSPEHLNVQSINNKQGRGDALTEAQSAMVLEMLKRDATQAYQTYSDLLGEEIGLARELARMNRVSADAIGSLVQEWVPHVWEAFQDYRMGGAFFARQELEMIQAWLKQETPSFEDSGLSKREWVALCKRFGRPTGLEAK